MRKKFMGVVAIGAAVLLMAATAAAAATVTVNETNLGADWTANIVGSGSGLAFVTEHGAPPGLGTGRSSSSPRTPIPPAPKSPRLLMSP